MRTGSTRVSRANKDTDEDEGEALATELALGSDGRIYINAEGIDPAKLKGRKMFVGYALTVAEAKRARLEMHRLAFNLTVAAKPTFKPAMKPGPKSEQGADKDAVPVKDPQRGHQETKAPRRQQNRRSG